MVRTAGTRRSQVGSHPYRPAYGLHADLLLTRHAMCRCKAAVTEGQIGISPPPQGAETVAASDTSSLINASRCCFSEFCPACFADVDNPQRALRYQRNR